MSSQIAVIGAGYVGLTSAACLAHLGHSVICADIDAERVDRLGRGEIPIAEDRLDHLVSEGLASGRLRFVVDATEAVAHAQFVCLCVSTPMGSGGEADLSHIDAAVADMADHLREGAVVMIKSTVPVGTNRRISKLLGRSDVEVVSTPEFLREGMAVHDFMEPDRIVIGAADPMAADRVASLFRQVPAPIVVTEPVSAELVKYAANAFLATKISFVNAVAALCEAVGADVDAVGKGLGYDPRIGRNHLQPGPGWGGSCLPKDVRALIHTSAEAGYDFQLLRSVVDVNEAQFERMVTKVADCVDGDLRGVTVAALGLAFKAGTDDLRDSPALAVIDRLVERGAAVRAHDPTVGQIDLAGVELCADAYAAATGAHILVLLTEWEDYRRLDYDRLAEAMSGRAVVDTRNVLDREALLRRGFDYRSVGRN